MPAPSNAWARVPRIAIAASHGEIGGGESMQLEVARALRALAVTPVIVAPAHPSDLADRAEDEGFETVRIPGHGEKGYLLSLPAWRLRHREVPLWCNGLAPALATAGLGPRIVHLHNPLETRTKRLLLRVARWGARTVVVPSRFMADDIAGADVLWNWTGTLEERRRRRPSGTGSRTGTLTGSRAAAPAGTGGPVRVGFIGRIVREKGVHVLARAMAELDRREAGRYELVLAGAVRFETETDRQEVTAALETVRHLTREVGWVAPADFFADVDIVCAPSVEEESFGLVVAEAMAAGVPCVISDCGAMTEVAGPSHPWVVPRGDALALADMLARVADSDTRRPVAAARQRWEREFSPGAGRRRVADLLIGLEERP